MNKLWITAQAALLVLSGAALSPAPGEAGTPVKKARLIDAHLRNVGMVKFREARDGKVVIEVKIRLAPPGLHGMHIHANDLHKGCLPPQFAAVGDHLVMAGDTTHGDHTGDLPDVLVNQDGTGHAWFKTDQFALEELERRAVVLHEGRDNHGNVPVGADLAAYTANSPQALTLTQQTGNAGARIACGVIRGQ